MSVSRSGGGDGRVHASSGIGDLENRSPAGVDRLNRHPQLAAGRHRVAAVDDQVGHDLLELSMICPHPNCPRRKTNVERDAVPDQSPEKTLQPGDDRVQVDGLDLDDLSASERQQLTCQVGAATCGGAYLADRVLRG